MHEQSRSDAVALLPLATINLLPADGALVLVDWVGSAAVNSNFIEYSLNYDFSTL